MLVSAKLSIKKSFITSGPGWKPGYMFSHDVADILILLCFTTDVIFLMGRQSGYAQSTRRQPELLFLAIKRKQFTIKLTIVPRSIAT